MYEKEDISTLRKSGHFYLVLTALTSLCYSVSFFKRKTGKSTPERRKIPPIPNSETVVSKTPDRGSTETVGLGVFGIVVAGGHVGPNVGLGVEPAGGEGAHVGPNVGSTVVGVGVPASMT